MNRLSKEKSPYLLQHAKNPVDWYPWGEEAFAKSRQEKKPIFLSVGYSTCHWCHVMAHESFENESVAAILNEHFVSIKVDREERPDVDRIYMSALQAMGQDGGWPMSMFLTPDRRPFWGGTYFPPEARHGRAGFPEILNRIHEIWVSEREKVDASAQQLTDFLSGLGQSRPTGRPIGQDVLDLCFAQIEKTFDESSAGFGSGPKFPRPAVFHFLLRYGRRTGTLGAKRMVERTLAAMAAGGIHDQIGGGFHRYTVDRTWRVPHFEKMLYDQAQIVDAFVELYQSTPDPALADVIRDTCDYVLRDLTHPDGGFYSAEDADSPKPEHPAESGEGAFYLWTKREISDLLGDESELFCYAHGIEENGNAPFDPAREFVGRNILYRPYSLESVARRSGLTKPEVHEGLERCRMKLLGVRSKRPRPHLDDKIIAGWNGLMIGAMARAGAVLREDRYVEAARRGAGFVISRLYDAWARVLLRRYRDGDARHAATLEDYAFLISGLTDLYEVAGEIAWLRGAIRLADDMVAGFWDRDQGAFFDVGSQDTSLLVRMKEQHDGAEPAGNSVAAMAMLRLSEMTGNRDWWEKGTKTLAAFGTTLAERPNVMPYMAAALDFSMAQPLQIVIAGEVESHGTRRLAQEVFARFLPNKIVLYADGGAGQEELSEMLPFMKEMRPVEGKATGYVCRNNVCNLPTNDPAIFGELLEREM